MGALRFYRFFSPGKLRFCLTRPKLASLCSGCLRNQLEGFLIFAQQHVEPKGLKIHTLMTDLVKGVGGEDDMTAEPAASFISCFIVLL